MDVYPRRVTRSSTRNCSTSVPYLYQPLLKANEIRLLHIPTKTTSSQPDNYVLTHASLDSDVEYVALSYAWGDPTALREILINDQLVMITESLTTAIQALQRQDTPVTLWADAICIDQQNSSERTAQVQLMRRIYQEAGRVILWLGPSTPQSIRQICDIRKVGKRLVEAGIHHLPDDKITTWEVHEKDDLRVSKAKNEILKNFHDDLRTAKREGAYPSWSVEPDLGQRAWWKRVWCIQELSNARQATFKCGVDEVDFALYWAVAFYANIFTAVPPFVRNHGIALGDQLGKAYPATHLGIRRKTLLQGGYDLRTLLHITSVIDTELERTQASDPRDRVYALLGVASDAAARDIIADYNLTCDEVYIMTARTLLRHGHDDILSLCRQRNVCKELPSWVPDWSALNRKPWATWKEGSMFNASNIKATANRSSSLVVEEDSAFSSKLTLNAYFVDTIKSTGRVWSVGIKDEMILDDVRHVFDDVSDYLTQSTTYDQTQKQEAEWRLPVGDTQINFYTGHVGRTGVGDGMELGHKTLRELLDKDGKVNIDYDARLSSTFYFMQMCRMHDSRPCLSESGHVGVFPMGAQPGDVIVIIQGARVPYVVRKEEDGDCYTLVGESHVFGMMDGEFMKKEPMPIAERITLR